MGLGDGTRMDGTSSLDEPTGTRKYSMAAPSAGDRAAKRERKTNDMIDRNLQRAMRNGTPQQRVAAGVAYQERSRTPGYQQGGGIQSAEGNRNRDRQTADNFTKEGLRLEGKENPAEVIAGQVDATKKPGIGTATADGGTNSKIGTSKADASGRPRVTGQFEPGSELDKAEKNLWSKDPKPNGIGIPDKDGNITMTMDFRDSDKNGVDDKEDWLKRNPDYFNTGKGASAAPAGGAGGSPTAPTEQGAPAPAATLPVAQGGAGNGTSAVPEWRDERKNAIEEQVNNFKRHERIKKLGEDLKIWGKQTEGGPDFDEIVAYGKTLGLTEEDIHHERDKTVREEKERDVPIKRQNEITGAWEVDNKREASRKTAEEAIADFEREKKSRDDMTEENFPESFKADEDNRKLVANQIEENVKNYIPPVHPDHQASEVEMLEPLTGSDRLMPMYSPKEQTPAQVQTGKATAALAKTYGDYLNGEGKQLNGESADAWRARKDSKYDEITGKTPAKSVNPETAMLLKRHGKITSQLQDIESRESAFFA